MYRIAEMSSTEIFTKKRSFNENYHIHRKERIVKKHSQL